ncbi:hypothetical protein EGW08_017545, partial [Elysia chlorotica]
EHGLGVARHDDVVVADAHLQVGAVHGADPAEAGLALQVVGAEQLVDVVVQVRCLVLDDDAQRPGEEQDGGGPVHRMRNVPGQVVRVFEGYHARILTHSTDLKLRVDHVHALPALHVVVASLKLLEELRALLLELHLCVEAGEAEALAHLDLDGGEFLQVHQRPRDVLDPAAREVEGRPGRARVDPLII